VLQSSLRRILSAFAWWQPPIGYCQSMNFLAAILLFFMEEQLAFWMLHCTIQLLPPHYYSTRLVGIKADVLAFKQLFTQKLTKISKTFFHVTSRNRTFCDTMVFVPFY